MVPFVIVYAWLWWLFITILKITWLLTLIVLGFCLLAVGQGRICILIPVPLLPRFRR